MAVSQDTLPESLLEATPWFAKMSDQNDLEVAQAELRRAEQLHLERQAQGSDCEQRLRDDASFAYAIALSKVSRAQKALLQHR